MTSYEALVAEAAAADVTGWDFSWLDGRASEQRPPWGYARMLAARLPTVASALDLDTGGGEIIAGLPTLPARMAVTEAWPPNRSRAAALLAPRGVEIHSSTAQLADESVELITSRHPVAPDWPEIARLLRPGGAYLAQHVGPASAFELIEFFLGPLPAQVRAVRDPQAEALAAQEAGLTVVDLRTARCRMEFADVGAVVYLLRKCVWWVPDFDVARYDATLRELDARIRRDGVFVAHSTRHLIEARSTDRGFVGTPA